MASLRFGSRAWGARNIFDIQVVHLESPQFERTTLQKGRTVRSISSYGSKLQNSPLVRSRLAKGPTEPSPSSGSASRSSGRQKNVVYAPYTRITLGIVFCGALAYSMVCFFSSKRPRPLTNSHATSPPPEPPSNLPPPTSSNHPALPTETSSESVKAV